MDPARFLEVNAVAWTALLVLTTLSFVGAVVVGVGLLTSIRIRPFFAGLAMGPLALAAPLIAAGSSALVEPAQAPLLAAGALLVAPIFAWPVVVLLLALCAVAGARGAPRQVRPAIVAGVGVLGLVGALIMGFVGIEGLIEFAIVRAASYLVPGLLLIPAMLHGDPENSASVEAGAAAALALCAYVALAEAGVHGVIGYFLVGALGVAPAAARAEIVATLHASHVVPSTVIGGIVAGIAAVLALAAIGRAAVVRRRPSIWIGALWIPVVLSSLWLATPPQSAWDALAQALPEPEVAPAEPATDAVP